MRVLICGDRKWTDELKIRQITMILKQYIDDLLIIEGGAQGADLMARKAAVELGVEFLEFPAFWQRFGKAAGPIRNQQMLDEGKPDLVFAFHSNIEQSKGTKDMINRAKDAGIKYVVIP